MLIDAGADVDMHDARGFTPLYAAASGAHDRAVQMLLMAKCALSLAYRQTNIDLLDKSLTDFNANVFRHIVRKLADTRNLQLQPHKLLWFLEGEHYDIEKVRILLENGINANQMIGECGSILNYAALRGPIELVELLCKNRWIDIDQIHPDKTYGTPLQLAAFRGNDDGPRIVEILLARDANIYKGSGFYGSALNVAAAMPCLNDYEDKTKVEATYIQMAKLLISHEKTIVNFSAGYHGTPIQFAIATGSPAMFKFLLTQEPILSHPTGACGTVLHHAAYTSKSKSLQALLSDEEFDLLVSTRDKCGRLPLHIYFMKNRVSAKTIRRLSNNNATLLTTVSFQGLQPLHLAAGVGNSMGVAYILRQHGNAVNDKDADGWTALHWACRSGNNKEVVELLLKSGADKNATTDRGWTSFDVALYSGGSMIGNPEIRSLIKPDGRNGVDPSCVQPGIEVDDEEVLPPRTSVTPRSDNGDTYNCDACSVVSCADHGFSLLFCVALLLVVLVTITNCLL